MNTRAGLEGRSHGGPDRPIDVERIGRASRPQTQTGGADDDVALPDRRSQRRMITRILTGEPSQLDALDARRVGFAKDAAIGKILDGVAIEIQLDQVLRLWMKALRRVRS